MNWRDAVAAMLVSMVWLVVVALAYCMGVSA